MNPQQINAALNQQDLARRHEAEGEDPTPATPDWKEEPEYDEGL